MNLSIKHIYLGDTEIRFNKYPSDMKRQRLEADIEGLSIDHSDGDFGEGRTPLSPDCYNQDPNGENY